MKAPQSCSRFCDRSVFPNTVISRHIARATKQASPTSGKARKPFQRLPACKLCKLKATLANATHQHHDSASLAPEDETGDTSTATALVWFKSDLRVDDHPGLSRAKSSQRCVPLFIFNPSLYRSLLRTPKGLQGLVGALKALQQSLRKRSSNLLIIEGKAEEILPQLAAQYNATSVIAEEEVEFRWRMAVLSVQSSLPPAIELQLYKASLFTSEPYSDNFRQFQQQRGRPLEPLPAIDSLPSLPAELQIDSENASAWLQRWTDLVQAADEDLISPQVRRAAEDYTEGWATSNLALMEELANEGEPAALKLFREYVALEFPPANGSNSSLSDAVRLTETPATPLGSFPAIFAQSAALGVLSRRRIFWEAQKILDNQTTLQRLSNSGPLTARAAAVTAEAADFHWHVARADSLRDTKTGAVPRHWRWRGADLQGFLTDYFTADPEEYGSGPPDPEAPAFLLVHGFGAFGEQWRGQLQALAAAGHHVYAPTLPGYGRTEKPSLPYSQYLWVSFLRDFIVEVIRRPVVVAGNSIGGFISASLAADYKQIIQGLVLFNSAGLVQKNYKPPPESEAHSGSSNGVLPPPAIGPPGFVATALSKALLFYLEKTIARTLIRIYPVKPEMADTWLTAEIKRAAGDPGAQKVFRSVFYLPKPRALNYLVHDAFGKPTLIIQGTRDPLQNAKGRARSMQRLCPNVKVVLLDAGHCPFDERPDFCNTELLNFIDSLKRAPAPPAELASTSQSSSNRLQA